MIIKCIFLGLFLILASYTTIHPMVGSFGDESNLYQPFIDFAQMLQSLQSDFYEHCILQGSRTSWHIRQDFINTIAEKEAADWQTLTLSFTLNNYANAFLENLCNDITKLMHNLSFLFINIAYGIVTKKEESITHIHNIPTIRPFSNLIQACTICRQRIIARLKDVPGSQQQADIDIIMQLQHHIDSILEEYQKLLYLV